jgi:SPP1 gp7 family putative phage head morphogenesis protein
MSTTPNDRVGFRQEPNKFPPPRDNMAAFNTDPFNARRFLAPFLTELINQENVTLRRERSEDQHYAYPYGLFDEMRDKDVHLSALVDLRKQAVLDCERTFTPADETPQAKQLAEWAEWAVDQIGLDDGQDWRSVTDALLDSVGYGYRVCEYLWNTATFDREYWIADALVPRRPRRFTFGSKGELMLIGENMKAEPAPPYKFVVARLYAADDSPWGDPLLARAFHLWRFKKYVTAYWIAYCEKFGQPLITATLTDSFSGNDKDRKDLENALGGIQQEGYLIIPPGVKLDSIEFARQDSKDLYQSFMLWADRQLSKLWVGATMVMEESLHGTQAMSKVLVDQFHRKVRSDAKAVSKVWTKSILSTLIEVNFGPDAVKLTPTMELNIREEEDLELESKIDEFLLNAGLQLLKSEVYQRYRRELPKADVAEEDILEKKPQPQPLQLVQFPGQQPQQQDKPAKGKGKLPSSNEPATGDKPKDEPGKQRSFAEANPDFDALAIAMEADTDRERVVGDAQLAEAVRKGFDGLLANIRQRMGQAKDLRDLADNPIYIIDEAPLTAPLAALNKLAWLRGALKNAPNLGFVGIADRRQFGEGDVTLMNEEMILFAESGFDGLDLAIERAETLNILTRDEFDRLDDWSRSLAYTAANQTTETLQLSLKALVLDSIEEGISLSEAIDRVRPYWDPLPGATASNFVTEAHIENVIRTNTMRAYNQGWNDLAYTDGMADRYPMAQIVAIIDERTSPTCNALNGRIVTRDLVGELTPPFHYNCRTILVWLSVRNMDKHPASAILTRQQLSKLPEKEQPMPGFGRYTPLFGGQGEARPA